MCSFGADSGIRTRAVSLARRSTTTILYPHKDDIKFLVPGPSSLSAVGRAPHYFVLASARIQQVRTHILLEFIPQS